MARRKAPAVLSPALVLAVVCAAPAAASDVVVVRVGDGSATLGSAATAVFLERRTPGGSLVGGPIALPTFSSGANQAVTLSGSASSEGALTVSVDGHYVVLAGYAAVPGTPSVSSSADSSVNRVVARVDALGGIDTSTRLDTAFDQSSVRGAVTTDGSGFWVGGNGAGTAGGVWYLPLGTTGGTRILATPPNVRTVNIFYGQLFADSGSTPFVSVFGVGTGLPTSEGQTGRQLEGLPLSAASPYAFVFFSRNVQTLYYADDQSLANGGGIQKWTFDGVTWLQAAVFTNGFSSGVRGLTGEVVGASVVLYATTSEPARNHLLRLVDDGSAAPAAAVIATAPANTVYRGVTLAWTAPVVDAIFNDGFEP